MGLIDGDDHPGAALLHPPEGCRAGFNGIDRRQGGGGLAVVRARALARER